MTISQSSVVGLGKISCWITTKPGVWSDAVALLDPTLRPWLKGQLIGAKHVAIQIMKHRNRFTEVIVLIAIRDVMKRVTGAIRSLPSLSLVINQMPQIRERSGPTFLVSTHTPNQSAAPLSNDRTAFVSNLIAVISAE